MHKVLKKTIATLAMLSLVGSAIPMSASAVTYDRCDVNHDGVVNATDSLTIQRYLQGLTSSANYNQLDADCNLIVDYNDVQCVNSRILGKDYSTLFYSRELENLKMKYLFSPPALPSRPVLNVDAGHTEPCSYKAYSYIRKEDLDPYVLTPSTESINAQSGISTYFFNGEDDRKEANGLDENTGIVNLSSKKGNSTAISTGFIVGDHVIATAAHCVYSKNDKKFYNNMTVQTYGTDGKLTGKKLTAVEAHICEEYCSTEETRFDYALITVKENLSDYFQFELGNAYNITPGSFINIPIYITGCPGEVRGNFNKDNILYTDENRVSDISYSELYYHVDISDGDSGAPVYTITKTTVGSRKVDTATVLAIHHGEIPNKTNRGSLITNYHLQFYKNNPNINYVG